MMENIFNFGRRPEPTKPKCKIEIVINIGRNTYDDTRDKGKVIFYNGNTMISSEYLFHGTGTYKQHIKNFYLNDIPTKMELTCSGTDGFGFTYLSVNGIKIAGPTWIDVPGQTKTYNLTEAMLGKCSTDKAGYTRKLQEIAQQDIDAENRRQQGIIDAARAADEKERVEAQKRVEAEKAAAQKIIDDAKQAAADAKRAAEEAEAAALQKAAEEAAAEAERIRVAAAAAKAAKDAADLSAAELEMSNSHTNTCVNLRSQYWKYNHIQWHFSNKFSEIVKNSDEIKTFIQNALTTKNYVGVGTKAAEMKANIIKTESAKARGTAGTQSLIDMRDAITNINIEMDKLYAETRSTKSAQIKQRIKWNKNMMQGVTNAINTVEVKQAKINNDMSVETNYNKINQTIQEIIYNNKQIIQNNANESINAITTVFTEPFQQQPQPYHYRTNNIRSPHMVKPTQPSAAISMPYQFRGSNTQIIGYHSNDMSYSTYK